MVPELSSRVSLSRESTKAAEKPRPSLIALASAIRALKKITPSSQTLQRLLSSATLRYSEMYDSTSSTKLVELHQKNCVQLSVVAKPYSTSLASSEPPSCDAEADYDAKMHFRSTISSQRHLTFPQTSNTQDRSQSSLELQCIQSPWPGGTMNSSGHEMLVHDSTRAAMQNLLRTFSTKSVHVHGSQMIHRRDIAPMIELHMLAWREDRFVRRLQYNQISRAEIQSMRSLLTDRTTSALDNVLVARIGKSDKPTDIIGWLCCSIIRHKRNNKSVGATNGIRVLDWNLATAMNLNKGYNTGSKTYLFGEPGSLRERNDLIEVLCKGTRWSQKTEFQDQDFIAITNLVVHPTYPAGQIIRKQLVLEACKQAMQLEMPVYACVSEEACASLYRDDCGFTEMGEHVNLSFEPSYRWKYLVYRPSPQCIELLHTGKKECKSDRFDFGWRALRGPAK